MRIATWNVNSIRTRVDKVTDWLTRAEVDVLAIQETKCADKAFPALPFEQAGYEVAFHGLNQWNGVAIASRVGLSDVETGFPGMPVWGEPEAAAEARCLSAVCDGLRMTSVYVPNGRALGDPHMTYKLAWLDALAAAARRRVAADPGEQHVIAGDWNVAPTDEDVWDMAAFVGRTHVTPDERAGFDAVVGAGYADLVRPYAPPPENFTYWDYTQLRFPRRQGMRIDFLLGTAAVQHRVTGAFIDRDERKGKGTSDHAPVVVDLD